jgi:chromate transporter
MESGKIRRMLFTSMVRISAFTLGGGFVIIPLMRKRFVEELGWLEENEMLDYVAMAQSTPGATSVNIAVMIGHRMAGATGSLAAATGAVIPPVAIMCLVSAAYDLMTENPIIQAVLASMRSVIAAMIAVSVISMARSLLASRRAKGMCIAIVCGIALFFVSSSWVLIACLVCGVVEAFLRRDRQ